MKDKDIKKILMMTAAQRNEAATLGYRYKTEAINLERGPSNTDMVYHDLWESGEYKVGVGKPGKEATRKGNAININDMWPYIKEGNSFKKESASFKDVFKELEYVANKSRRSLELLACLFVRSAFMLDHGVNDDKVVFLPPEEIVKEIKKDIPDLYGVSLEAFLQYVEMIALNEEVKYHTRGEARGKPYGPGAGRKNNLLTCAHLIAVLLGRASMIDFAYGFSMMRGVSPLSLKKALVYFPFLEGNEDDEGKTHQNKKNRKKS